VNGAITNSTLFFLSSVLSYLAYTPLHEAAHGGIGKPLALNLWTGRVAGLFFYSPFKAYRHMHIEHHRHVNHESKDPDLWSGKSFPLLRWITQDLHYYWIFLRDAPRLDRSVRSEAYVQMAFSLAIAAVAICFGYGKIVLWGWFLPARVAIAWLAFSFNYLPHYPHDPALRDTEFKATMIRSSGWLDWPLLMQNFHLIHHLYPKVPFYRYRRIWTVSRNRLLEKNVVEVAEIFKLS
jgi:fatty acid desaturase